MSAFWHNLAVCLLCILYIFMYFEKRWLFKKILTGVFIYFDKQEMF